MKRPKNIMLYVRELAEMYALRTLYDYLTEHQALLPDIRFIFGGSLSERCKELLESRPVIDFSNTSPLDVKPFPKSIGCFSDIGGSGNLEIDISLLKNAVIPLTDDEKSALHEKYAVPKDKPVVVIGHASYKAPVMRVIKELGDDVDIYLVGAVPSIERRIPDKSNVHLISKYGILKDYYAMADVALDASLLEPSSFSMHNFVEATEGGPLFAVPSRNTSQYGYPQLVNRGAIIECKHIGSLIDRMKRFLSHREEKAGILKRRASHIKFTRENYMPVILAYVKQMCNEPVYIPDSDLIRIPTTRGTRLMHPITAWGTCLDTKKDDQGVFIPNKVYEDPFQWQVDLYDRLKWEGTNSLSSEKETGHYKLNGLDKKRSDLFDTNMCLSKLSSESQIKHPYK